MTYLAKVRKLEDIVSELRLMRSETVYGEKEYQLFKDSCSSLVKLKDYIYERAIKEEENN